MKALLKQRGLKSKISEREEDFGGGPSISSYLRGTSATRELAPARGSRGQAQSTRAAESTGTGTAAGPLGSHWDFHDKTGLYGAT